MKKIGIFLTVVAAFAFGLTSTKEAKAQYYPNMNPYNNALNALGGGNLTTPIITFPQYQAAYSSILFQNALRSVASNPGLSTLPTPFVYGYPYNAGYPYTGNYGGYNPIGIYGNYGIPNYGGYGMYGNGTYGNYGYSYPYYGGNGMYGYGGNGMYGNYGVPYGNYGMYGNNRGWWNNWNRNYRH
jgi:hypothetical protein